MIPDKIYLNIHPDWTEGEDEPEVTWSEVEDPFYNNIPYIRKDALLEWARYDDKLGASDEPFRKYLINHIESL